jgi:hypothetical protein
VFALEYIPFVQGFNMFSNFIQELRGFLGKGYVVSVFVPTLVFCSIFGGIGIIITLGILPATQLWIGLPVELKIVLSLSGLLLVSFLAYLVHNFQFAISQLFEGYWQGWPILGWIQESRRKRYLEEWQYLGERITKTQEALNNAQQNRVGATEDIQTVALDIQTVALQAELNEVTDRWLTYFPPPSKWAYIRPTRFGNILRSGELYAEDHYGLDAVVIWTRLRPFVPAAMLEALQDRKISIDFMLLMTLYSGCITLFWCPMLLVFTKQWLLFLACAFGLPIAFVCYQNAVQSAIAYSEQVRSIFDLHRRELIFALGLKVPLDIEDERQFWSDISQFFHGNIPYSDIVQYAVKPDEAHRYILPPTPPTPMSQPQTTGMARVTHALVELWEGLKEVSDGK